MMYLKRFYLHHSCLNHDPARLMLTCIYVAGKVGWGRVGRRSDGIGWGGMGRWESAVGWGVWVHGR